MAITHDPEIFLSTPSARRATRQDVPGARRLAISIHALREEGDRVQEKIAGPAENGISIHALREEGDSPSLRTSASFTHFYPRPPRGGRPKLDDRISALERISIHALREEGDSKNGEKHLRFCFIIKRSAQIWKSFSKNIRKNSCNLHRTA